MNHPALFREAFHREGPVSPSQLASGIAPGNNWHFEVNEKKVWGKASNLVPLDVFWPRVTAGSFQCGSASLYALPCHALYPIAPAFVANMLVETSQQYSGLFVQTLLQAVWATTNGYQELDCEAGLVVERLGNVTEGSACRSTDYYDYDTNIAFNLATYAVGNEFGFHSQPSYQTVLSRNHHHPINLTSFFMSFSAPAPPHGRAQHRRRVLDASTGAVKDWTGKSLGGGKADMVAKVNSTRVFAFNTADVTAFDLSTAVAILSVEVVGGGGRGIRTRIASSRCRRRSQRSSGRWRYASSSTFVVEAHALAAFVWLDHPADVLGYWMLLGTRTMTLTVFEDSTGNKWVDEVVVDSRWTLTSDD
ncbi:glycoside hydrolase family 2 protein [Athelia psychrophila]|uniref:Glycoside hydrolase family 2 protein n=1 Tax=Athelia psychrophila TaxID=1759441 RepID=A0A166A397_9AGAM|nr:glycoside hydrolase family 2 protein [Fibularhizoctonia sp. CBS 109695]